MLLSIEKSAFGVTGDGQPVDRYRLQNGDQSRVDVLTYGGIISSWLCADRDGGTDNIVLGYDTLADYEACEIYMGCVVGRYANRIAHGRFTLAGESYQLAQNCGAHHLHGGEHGLHKVVWQGAIEHGDVPALVLSHHSRDGAGGYPGNLSVSVRFSLSADNKLTMAYRATTDQPTVVNLTSHSYFNLRGDQHAGDNGILDHQLQLHAGRVLEVNEDSIPTGRLLPVAGGVFDFTSSRPVGLQLQTNPDLYDHCYALDGACVDAWLSDPVSGRTLEVATTLPGMQLYSAGFVRGCRGRSGAVYGRRGSLCLEPQLYPDAPNQPTFPSALLQPGQCWSHETTYRLSHPAPTR